MTGWLWFSVLQWEVWGKRLCTRLCIYGCILMCSSGFVINALAPKWPLHLKVSRRDSFALRDTLWTHFLKSCLEMKHPETKLSHSTCTYHFQKHCKLTCDKCFLFLKTSFKFICNHLALHFLAVQTNNTKWPPLWSSASASTPWYECHHASVWTRKQ